MSLEPRKLTKRMLSHAPWWAHAAYVIICALSVFLFTEAISIFRIPEEVVKDIIDDTEWNRSIRHVSTLKEVKQNVEEPDVFSSERR